MHRHNFGAGAAKLLVSARSAIIMSMTDFQSSASGPMVRVWLNYDNDRDEYLRVTGYGGICLFRVVRDGRRSTTADASRIVLAFRMRISLRMPAAGRIQRWNIQRGL